MLGDPSKPQESAIHNETLKHGLAIFGSKAVV